MNSAKKRDIPFELTFQEFCDFDEQTGYIEKRGTGPDSLTIDRIDSNLPYRLGNIRALTWDENCKRLVEGMTQPWEPIAQMLAQYEGSLNRFAHQMEALKLLRQVEILQEQRQVGFNPNTTNEVSELFG